MSNPLISVIMPVYNGAAFIHEAINSVLKQSYPHLEIIIINDGSTDDSDSVIRKVSASLSLLLHYHYQENRGPSAARNRGIEMAHGEILAFIDADDLWDDEKLAVQMAHLETQPEILLAWGNVQIFEINEQGQRMPKGQPWHGPNLGSALFRQAAFEQVGLFDENMRYSEDLDWFLRAEEKDLPRINHLETVLWYRHHDNNMWLGQSGAFQKTFHAVKRRLDRRRAGPS